MKYIKHRRIILLSLILVYLLSGCSSDNNIQIDNAITPEPIEIKGETEKETDLGLISPVFVSYDGLVQDNGQYSSFYKATIGCVDYYIDKNEYTEDECVNIINEIYNVFTFLQKEYTFPSDESLCVYIGSKIITQGIKGNIYLNTNDLWTQEALITITAGFYGELVNYGLCYGLSIIANEQLGWKDIKNPEIVYDVSKKQLISYFSNENNMILLDLNIPMFEPIYFSVEDNMHVASATYYLTKFIIDQYGVNELVSLISKSSEITIDYDIQYTMICNEWLSSIGALYYRTTPEVAIRCIKNNERSKSSYEYVFYTHYMKSFISKNHLDASTGIILTYPEIIHLLTLGDADLKNAIEYLAPYFVTDLERIPCYYYMNNMDRFYINYISYASPYTSFTHEYVHYITDEYTNVNPLWLIDGLATYITYYIPNNLAKIYVKCYFETTKKRLNESGNVEYYAGFMELYNMYTEVINNAQGKNNEGNAFCDLTAYMNYNFPLSKYPIDDVYGSPKEGGFMSYLEAGSMINYLIEEYGADIFFSVYKGEIILDKAYGKTLYELYEEWGEYLNKKYKNIDKQKMLDLYNSFN